jgi:hypothetical protein
MAGRSKDTSTAVDAVLLSASASAFPTCRALNVGTAGTATMRSAKGNTLTDYPLQAGYNPIQIDKLTALGTAANVWALY